MWRIWYGQPASPPLESPSFHVSVKNVALAGAQEQLVYEYGIAILGASCQESIQFEPSRSTLAYPGDPFHTETSCGNGSRARQLPLASRPQANSTFRLPSHSPLSGFRQRPTPT